MPQSQTGQLPQVPLQTEGRLHQDHPIELSDPEKDSSNIIKVKHTLCVIQILLQVKEHHHLVEVRAHLNFLQYSSKFCLPGQACCCLKSQGDTGYKEENLELNRSNLQGTAPTRL